MLNTGEGKPVGLQDEAPDIIQAAKQTEKVYLDDGQTELPALAARSAAASFLDDAATLTENSWKNIIWREWCRAEDEEYAENLYLLVRTSVLGWKFVALFTLVCALGGGFTGLFLGNVVTELLRQTTSLVDTNVILLPTLFAWGLGVVGAAFGVWSSRMYRTWYYWWQGAPPPAKVESALREACRTYPEVERIWNKPLNHLTLEKVRHRSVEELIAELANPNWSYRFAARLALAARGGEAAAALHAIASDRDNSLWEVATWLLTNIEQQTRNAYAWRIDDTVCPYCMTRFGSHPLDMSLGITFTIYGCRRCKQSLEYYYVPQGVVAVLDNEQGEEPIVKDGLLRVNWLARRKLFDFNRVEILQATDEDVERFAVQVGNDTDPARKDRYRYMACRIGCVLSQNSVRILRRTFGDVAEHEPIA